MRFLKMPIVLVWTAAAVGAVTPDSGRPVIDDAELQQLGFVKFWEARVPLGEGDTLRDGYLVDEALYVTTTRGNLFALKADVGLLRWGAELTEADYHIFPPTHVRAKDGNGPVVIPTTTGVFVFDRFSGELRQKFMPPFTIGSSAVGYDDKLFMGGADGKFYSLLNDPSLAQPYKRWEVLVDGPVTAMPRLLGRDQLLFATQGGVVYSCLGADKTLLWSFRAGGAIVGAPAVGDDGVFAASADRSLYKLHPGTGAALWRARFPRPLAEGPSIVGGKVLQYGADQGMTALDPSTGRETWRRLEARSLVSFSSSGITLFTIDGRLEVVDAETGEVRGAIDAPLVKTTVSNTRDDAVYLLGRGGGIVCARLDEVPYLRRQQVAAARERLHRAPAGENDESARVLDSVVSEPEDPVGNDPLRSDRKTRP